MSVLQAFDSFKYFVSFLQGFQGGKVLYTSVNVYDDRPLALLASDKFTETKVFTKLQYHKYVW